MLHDVELVRHHRHRGAKLPAGLILEPGGAQKAAALHAPQLPLLRPAQRGRREAVPAPQLVAQRRGVAFRLRLISFQIVDLRGDARLLTLDQGVAHRAAHHLLQVRERLAADQADSVARVEGDRLGEGRALGDRLHRIGSAPHHDAVVASRQEQRRLELLVAARPVEHRQVAGERVVGKGVGGQLGQVGAGQSRPVGQLDGGRGLGPEGAQQRGQRHQRRVAGGDVKLARRQRADARRRLRRVVVGNRRQVPGVDQVHRRGVQGAWYLDPTVQEAAPRNLPGRQLGVHHRLGHAALQHLREHREAGVDVGIGRLGGLPRQRLDLPLQLAVAGVGLPQAVEIAQHLGERQLVQLVRQRVEIVLRQLPRIHRRQDLILVAAGGAHRGAVQDRFAQHPRLRQLDQRRRLRARPGSGAGEGGLDFPPGHRRRHDQPAAHQRGQPDHPLGVDADGRRAATGRGGQLQPCMAAMMPPHPFTSRPAARATSVMVSPLTPQGHSCVRRRTLSPVMMNPG